MIKDIDKNTSLHLNNEAQFLCFTLDDLVEEKAKSTQELKDEQKEHKGPMRVAEKETQIYAMNVFKIREVIYYTGEVTETAGENDKMVVGFLSVRGESIPLVDMRRWLYYTPTDIERDLSPYSIVDDRYLVAICNFSNFTVGIRIKNVNRIIHKSWNDIKIGSEYGFDGASKVTATMKYDNDEVVQILDVERMVADAFPSVDEGKALELDKLTRINSNKTILIAEDSKSASEFLQHILDRLEVKYLAFNNGKALLDYLYSAGVAENVGAIITDLEMPVVSGFEVLKRVKMDERLGNIPVIINSSMSNDSNQEMAATLRADGFITKSNPKEIEASLKKYLVHEEPKQEERI